MDRTISKGLRNLFLVHALVSLILGIPLWMVPGRFLELVGWVPGMVRLPDSKLSVPGQTFIDEVITRLLGAVLIALALSSLRGYRAGTWARVELLVEMEAVFCVLGSLSVIVTGLFLMERRMPPFGWAMAAVLAVFAVAWVLALRKKGAPNAA